MRVTLADVAELARVTPQTVSHVLGNKPGIRVAQETRVRIFAAAKELGYQPNRLAQAMKTGKTGVVSAWIPIDRPNLTALRFLQSLHSVVSESQYELIVSGLSSTLAYTSHGEVPNLFPVDGVIAFDSEKAFKAFRGNRSNDHVPGLILGYEQFTNSDSVAWDLHGTAVKVVRSMIKSGSNKIVHLLPDWIESGFPKESRRRAYTETMLGQHLIPQLIPTQGETAAAAEQAMNAYIEQDNKPNGVFAFNDSLAIGALRALHAYGITVPDQCQIWGFGDYPEGQLGIQSISTIRIPFGEISRNAWELLSARIDGNRADSILVTLPMEIVPRDSSRN